MMWVVHTRRELIALLLALPVAGAAGTACSSNRRTSSETQQDFSARFAQYDPAPEPNGDLAKVVWPNFVTDASPEVKRLYEFQVTHGELMRYMPCFCGCGRNAGHRSNRDCYVRRVRPNGSVEFDAMAPT
jgi:hypothetical protein